MRNLVYKEFKLSISWFFYVLPFMLACLMFIPQWIYTFVFMYFFWITIIQICAGYIAREDNGFNAMLPVTKREIVLSKISAILIIEGIHILAGVIFGIIHNQLYGSYNFFMDINIAFFGVMIVMYSIFNIIFLPQYFKTAYYYGKVVVIGVIVVLVYGFIFEYGALRFEFMRDIFEGTLPVQLLVFGIASVITIILNYIAIRKSVYNYESIA